MENACLFHANCSDGFHIFASVMAVLGAFFVIAIVGVIVYLICEFVITTNACNDLTGENYRQICAVKDQIRHLEEKLPKGDS